MTHDLGGQAARREIELGGATRGGVGGRVRSAAEGPGESRAARRGTQGWGAAHQQWVRRSYQTTQLGYSFLLDSDAFFFGSSMGIKCKLFNYAGKTQFTFYTHRHLPISYGY